MSVLVPLLDDLHSRATHRMLTFRLTHRWTQTDLANAMTDEGVEWFQPTVSNIERGRRELTLREAIALAEILGITLEELIA